MIGSVFRCIASRRLGSGVPRLATCPQRLGLSLARARGAQQRIDLDAQHAGQAVEHVHRWISSAALDPAEVRRGHAGIDRQRFLRQAAGGTQTAQVPREAPPTGHPVQARNLSALIHELYDRNYGAVTRFAERLRTVPSSVIEAPAWEYAMNEMGWPSGWTFALADLCAALVAQRRSLFVGAALAVGAGLLGHVPAQAQSGASAVTLPSCETFQRQRPRGGDPEQLSDLFGFSIYRWSETDWGRYRDFLIDCKRSSPSFRPELTFRDWEGAVEKSVASLREYTGFLDRLRQPAFQRRGPLPGAGEPDHTLAFRTMGCDRFTRESVNAWARGGPPDNASAAPFAVPLAAWHYEVWRAFENRVMACVQLPGPEAQTERDWLHTLVHGQEVNNAAAIRRAQQDVATGAAKLNGILARATEAEGLSSADELAGKLKAVETLAATDPKLAPADEERVAAAKERITARLRTARAAEAEAWERDRPAREARARQQGEELAGLQRQNREREADAAAERERAAKFEAERQASARIQAEKQAQEVEAQRQRDEAARLAEKQAREKADAETFARLEREDQARLASDPCNKIEMRRKLMEAANAMPVARYGGRKLLDLTNGRTNELDSAQGQSCIFVADWSSGERGLVTITLRKNSFGDNLIEVRPFGR